MEAEAEDAASEESDDGELFGTATMAELYARQGRVAEAVAIYRRLLASGPPPEERVRWNERLEALDRARAPLTHRGLPLSELPRPPVGRTARPARRPALLVPPPPVAHAMPLVVRAPV